jgi:hypothetical protein
LVTTDDALESKLNRALKNGKVEQDASLSYSFGKVWHWQPVTNANLYVAEWVATSKDSKTKQLQLIAIQSCPSAIQLLAKLPKAVDELGEPEMSLEATRGGPELGLQPQMPVLSLSAKSGDDTGKVRFEYVYGQVQVKAPAWLKASAKN